MGRAVIIGFGTIGRRLREKLLAMGWDIPFVIKSKEILTGNALFHLEGAVKSWIEYCRDVDVVFLAIPTLDDGSIALRYLLELSDKGIPVVTCEKGALSNYFEVLKPRLAGIRYTAACGGGSGMIPFLQERFFSGTRQVYVIPNGTMNYIFSGLAMGNPRGQIIEEVKKLRYAEPGESDSVEIIMAEVEDAAKKISLLFNLCFGSSVILRAKEISISLTEGMVEEAIGQARMRRFVVSFLKEEGVRPTPNNIEAFRHSIDGWVIQGGFPTMDNQLIARLCAATTWVNNGLLTVEGCEGTDGVYLCVGPGAGASPTTAAMIRDAEKLLKKH
jgi:homoserine dehydrogenase